jgi:hypothetical protein
MPKLTIVETGKEAHLWWHNFIPNKNVYYETIKSPDKKVWVTTYKCHWCAWVKTIIKEF